MCPPLSVKLVNGVVTLWLLFACSHLLFIDTAHAREALDCPFANRTPSHNELAEVLEARSRVFRNPTNLSQFEEARGDLCKANLANADLKNVDLRFINLSGANLEGADLAGAKLEMANLAGAKLYRAKLNGALLGDAKLIDADLWEANLSGAFLSDAILRDAHLGETNLSGAILKSANLAGANIIDVDLRGADLTGANLTDASFEAKFLPDPTGWKKAHGLSTMKHLGNRSGLIALRESFAKAGMREQEREVIYALKHTDRQIAWDRGDKFESAMNLVLFEWPTGYGMDPNRPLWLMLYLICGSSFLYAAAIYKGTGKIKVVWPKELHRDDDLLAIRDKSVNASANLFFPRVQRKWPMACRNRILRYVAVLPVGFWFSVLTCFRIGWREFSFGTGLSRLQPREYTLVPTGWIRVVAGIQSMISVYLFISLVLIYLGPYFGFRFE